MTEKTPISKDSISADWLFRGVLTKLGDTFDRFTGRRWIPSSSLATSELVERLKTLLDSEVIQVSGKGAVVPHNISLKMQWDKFSDDAEKGIAALRTELLTSAADHINDSLYYTLAPLTLEVKTDYFTEGVKLSVSFEKFDADAHEVEMAVTMPSLNNGSEVGQRPPATASHGAVLIARYLINNIPIEAQLELSPDGRISVGRTSENMLILDDPSVSKMHASLLQLADGGLAVADTGSTNGTFINQERIAYGRSLAFRLEDKVKFGDVEVTFERVGIADGSEEAAKDPFDNSVKVGALEFTNRKPLESAPEVQSTKQSSISGSLTIPPIEVDASVPEPAVDADGPDSDTSTKTK